MGETQGSLLAVTPFMGKTEITSLYIRKGDFMNEYEKQAQGFLDKTGTDFKADYVDYKVRFEGDKDKRDVYLITLTRGGKIVFF